MIPTKIFKDVGMALLPGEQIHINHIGCPSGVDTKLRLYIKRVPGGVVAFCHHCSDWGKYTSKDDEGVNLRKWLENKPSGEIIRVNREEQLRPYPILNVDIKQWLYTKHIDYNDLNFCETSTRNLGMKLWNPNGSLSGMQVRNFSGKGPKYLTYYYSTSQGDAAWHGRFRHDALVITEDYCSAYRVFEDTKIPAVALLKTSMSARTEQQILDAIPRVIHVWLDPDKPGREAAKKIWSRLCYLNAAETIILRDNEEPKNLFPEEVRGLLCPVT